MKTEVTNKDTGELKFTPENVEEMSALETLMDKRGEKKKLALDKSLADGVFSYKLQRK